jgi:hypothetical protein
MTSYGEEIAAHSKVREEEWAVTRAPHIKARFAKATRKMMIKAKKMAAGKGRKKEINFWLGYDDLYINMNHRDSGFDKLRKDFAAVNMTVNLFGEWPGQGHRRSGYRVVARPSK